MLAIHLENPSSKSIVPPGREDRDVKICLSRKPENRFVVHSVVLSLHFSFKTILSNRWASGIHGSAEEGSIKWKYQSRFDEADGDSNDQLDLLARAVSQARLCARPQYLFLGQTAEAVLAVETPGLNIDTAAIFTKFAAWIPQNNSKISSRTHTIEAHRHYSKLIHHIPLAIDPSNFDYVVKSLCSRCVQ